MTNKKKFKQLLLELNKFNKNISIKLFPIREEVSELIHLGKLEQIIDEVKLDMMSITIQNKKIDIYQKYFKDYSFNTNSLIIKFKYNKKRKSNLV